jgi:LAO/AO transport system kinase
VQPETDDVDVPLLARAVRSGDRRALARAITLMESMHPRHQSAATQLLSALLPYTGGAWRIAVSGAPGVGKSTFIDALGMKAVIEGHRVAVLAVDPSSALSGGSILGDKTRMAELAASPHAFVRPSPAQSALGGVARRTREALLLAESGGYDIVIVETVGVGQSQHAVSGMVDTFLLLLIAGAGDELQGIKRGIVEVADVFVVNKADGDGRKRAEQAAAIVRGAIQLLMPSARGWSPPVVTASALERQGIDQVWESIAAHRELLAKTGELDAKRVSQRRAWLNSLLDEGLRSRFLAHPEVKARFADIEAAVERAELTPNEGAEQLLALFCA